MNKEISKKIFIKNKILTPKFIKYSFDKSKVELNNLIEKGDTIKGEILSKKNINFNENTLLLVVKN